MITFVRGNILEADAAALVNTVNCTGVMGKGLALQFKRRFPEMYAAYRRHCKQGKLRPGGLYIWQNPAPLPWPQYVINFATKDHWSKPSQEDWIVAGLWNLSAELRALCIDSVAIPPLGCGLGGLAWPVIKEHIQEVHDLCWEHRNILVYEP